MQTARTRKQTWLVQHIKINQLEPMNRQRPAEISSSVGRKFGFKRQVSGLETICRTAQHACINFGVFTT